MNQTALTEADLSLTGTAQIKMAELFEQVDGPIEGVRVFASPGGCSGVSFGMTFTDQVNGNDGILECDGFKVIVDDGTLQYLRGVEIDFIDKGEGNASFIFNNVPQMGAGGGGGCGGCGSSSSGGSGGGCA